MNRLAILVVCWNNVDDVRECVDSLLAQTKSGFTILILDNGSTDPRVNDSLVERVKEWSKNTDLRLITSTRNDGTAGAFSIGVQWAIDNNYEYIGALNADAIAGKDWVNELHKELVSHKNIGAVTGQLLHRDGKTIDTTGDFYTTWGVPGPRLRDQSATLAPKKSGYIFSACGGAFLARTQVFKDTGLFDLKFFMYYEDIDMWYRAQLAGWKVRYTPSAIAYHKLGASSKTVPGLAVYNTFKNLPMLFLKNTPLSLWPQILPRFTLAYILILGNAIVHGNGWPALKGWGKSLVLTPHALRERQRIQKTRTVSDEYIDSIILHDIPPEQTGLCKFRGFFTGK